MSNEVKIYYRFNTGEEKKYLLDNKNEYHGIVISAHICTFYSDMIMSFLKKVKKPYFVDPITYIFGLSPDAMKKDGGDLKKSYEQLINYYGEPFSDFLGRDKLDPSILSSSEKEKLVKKTLELQKNLLSETGPSQRSLNEYIHIMGGNDDEEDHLEFLIPPYFYSKNIDDEFYKLSLELSLIARDLEEDARITPVICISKELLEDENHISQVIQDYSTFDSCIIWLANFKEKREDVVSLTRYTNFIDMFSEQFETLITLYGGEFSLISSKFGLTGMASGICYSSYKNPKKIASGGGFPLRYFIPEAHTKTVEANARTYYTKHKEMLCECSVCSGLKNDYGSAEEFFKNLGRENAKTHFIHKLHEIKKEIEQTDISDIRNTLYHDLKVCKNNKLMENFEIDYSHIARWIKVLGRYD